MGLSNSLPNTILQPGVCTSTTRPANPYPGQAIYETDTDRSLIHDGVSWLVTSDDVLLSLDPATPSVSVVGGLNVSGDVAVATNALYVDSVNNRVGVGTISPNYTLEVDGITKTGNLTIWGDGFDDTTLSFVKDGEGTASIKKATGHVSISAINDAETAYEDVVIAPDGGNVGIGTTTPANTLDVSGGLTVQGTTLTQGLTVTNFGGSSVEIQGGMTVDTGTLYVDPTNNRVGVGTTSPAEELHVVKDQNGQHTEILVENLDQRLRLRSYYQAGVTQYSSIQSEMDAGADIALALNPEGGNVGVGTVAPAVKLHVSSGTAGDAELRIEADTDNNDEGDVPYITFAADGGILEAVIGLNDNRFTFASGVTSNSGFDFRTGTTNYYTNGADVVAGTTSRMVISSLGHVITPNQPSFHAYGNPNTASGTDQIFPTVQHNIGNYYSTSTGRFTCPVSGTYLFCWYGLGNNGQDVYRYFFRINGSNWNDLHVRVDGAATGSEYPGYERSIILYLNANDFVNIFYTADSGSSHYAGDANSSYHTFSGRLLG